MRLLTKRQELFADYLLRKLTFEDSDLLNKYLDKLLDVCGSSGAIDELLTEVKLKGNLQSVKHRKYYPPSLITASDLASFTFCPASFSISKSFVIEFDKNEKLLSVGKQLHESIKLRLRPVRAPYAESDVIDEDILRRPDIAKIRNCSVHFAGHVTDVVFKNEEVGFCGQPDYIFEDPNGKFFVVEEKFKYRRDNRDDLDEGVFYNETEQEPENVIRKEFFQSHLIQLKSYMNYIKEFNIEYGVLIIWYYDFRSNVPWVYDASIKVVKKNELDEALIRVNQGLKKLISDGEMGFETSINPNKCAACSVNKYCGHKTKLHRDLTLPYEKTYMRLRYVDFPEELKKQ